MSSETNQKNLKKICMKKSDLYPILTGLFIRVTTNIKYTSFKNIYNS